MSTDSAALRAGQPRRISAAVVSAAYAFALVSAVAALVYQVAWTRLLMLSFGRSTLAVSAVVAGFMGGMAIGAWLYARASAGRASFGIYAMLEIGIACSAALLTLALVALPDVFASVASWIPAGTPLQFARVAAVFCLLLPPTALMGATLPALCAILIRSRPRIATHLGRIYGVSTLGAALGACLAGFVLIEQFGVLGALALAVTINGVIALAAAVLAKNFSSGDVEATSEPDAAASSGSASLPVAAVYSILIGSGFATLGYEIAWFRALQYLFGNSTYAITLNLAIFLVGLGLGGALFGRVARRRDPVRDLALCQFAIGGFALMAIATLCVAMSNDALMRNFSIFFPEVMQRVWWKRLLVDAGFAVLVMLPATLCMGLAFPLATRLLLLGARPIGHGVGRALAWSNAGGVLGAGITALVLLPALGTIGVTQALAGLNLALGILALVNLRGVARLRPVPICVAIAVIAALGLALPARLPFRGEARSAFDGAQLVFEREGGIATVQVWESPAHARARAMTIDGAIIAVNRGWFYPIYSKQKLLAHLPMLLDASITRTLNVGLGSGATVQALAGYPSVTRLDVVEISRDVVRASGLFEESGVLQDPRTQVIIEDAVHFLLQDRDAYDLIIADGKQHPEFSHNWATMTREFYSVAGARLTPAGLFVQWLPLATLDEDFVVALRTFFGVFPEVEIFLDAPHWIIMVGSHAPIIGRSGITDAQIRHLPASGDLKDFGLRSGSALLATWVANRSALEALIGAGEISTWNRTRLEFSSYRTDAAIKARAPRENLALLIRAGEIAAERGAPPGVDPDALRLNDWLRRAQLALLDGDRAGARDLVRRAQEIDARDPRARALLGLLEAPSRGSDPRRVRPHSPDS